MIPGRDGRCEPVGSSARDDFAFTRLERILVGGAGQVPAGPCRKDPANVSRILFSRQEMICRVETHEALRVLCGGEQGRGIIDFHDIIERCVHDQ